MGRLATGILSFLALAACIAWIGVAAQSSPEQSLPAILYTTTPNYVIDAWIKGGDRFPAGAQVLVHQGGRSRALVTGFAATADPAVSFDGTKILFSGKQQTKDPWQIWEVAVSGGAATRITTCASDCVRPFYLPGNRLVYARKTADGFVLQASALEGGTALQLTYGPVDAMPTDVLRDGRILFEATYPIGSGTSPEIYTVYPDGSGVESYRCDHGAKRQGGKQAASGDIVFVSDDGLGRFTSALAHQVDMKTPDGQFAGEAVEVAASDFLVSWRADTKGKYSLQRWNQATNSLAVVVASNDADAVQPALIQPREMPKLYPSGLHDWNYANLLCLSTYTSKYKFATGSVSGMKLYTRDENGKPRLLGSSSVEQDGSFYVQVPGDKPLQIELVDKQGKTLQREHGWWWMRSGEQRICVGCHAGPERSLENAVPAVLVKSTKPVVMTGTASVNAKGGK